MANNVQSVNNNIKAGTCPHGLAPGACPVCSMSGGGTLRQSDRNRKIGEMTYHECAMIGNMLKARALAQKNHEINLKQHALNVSQFETAMAKAAEVIKQFIQSMSQNLITKPAAFIAQTLILPIINILQNIPRFFINLRFQLPDIMDKLTAVFGELKAFLNKKIEEAVKVLKSGLEGLMKIFRKKNTDNNDTKIDDDKKIFNLKTILHKVKEKLKRKKDKKNERSSEN